MTEKPSNYFRPPGPDLHINAAARILGTDRKTINRLIDEGKLKAYRLTSKTLRVTRESLIAFRQRGVL